MRLTIQIDSGPQAGKRATLTPPATLSIGRGPAADWAVPEDRCLSNPHFEIAYAGGGWLLRDLESANGTFVDGKRVSKKLLTRECAVAAGRTAFTVTPELTLADTLAASQPLYAILDSARTPRILELLGASAERFECLYSGESAVHLAACAPYLVMLPARSRLLRRLVREGWGESWGIFVTCDGAFEEVRKHFRQFLKVQDEAGVEYLFRFYDPRVLRAFLPGCSGAERAAFFGAATAIWADDPAPLREAMDGAAVDRDPAPQ